VKVDMLMMDIEGRIKKSTVLHQKKPRVPSIIGPKLIY